MSIKHCVIHRNSVYQEARRRDFGSELELSKKAEVARKTIDDLIENKIQELHLFDTEDPRTIGDYFDKGDEVILYGAFLGMCLPAARTSLIRKGVKVSYHPDGCI